MSVDKLLWGSARPLFRIGNNRYVLNQPPSEHDIDFPKRIILNDAVKGKLFEHLIGNRGIFTITFDKLDRPSCETLIDILNSSSDKYMRPHFNFWKEYLIRCANGWELDRISTIKHPYKGTLIFETIELESSIPNYSAGSFLNNGTTTIQSPVLSPAITDDVSVDFWIKWHSMAGGIIYVTDQNSPDQVHWQIDSEPTKKLNFITGLGGIAHSLLSNTEFDDGIWYHVCCKRINTDDKYIYVNGVLDASGSDSKPANDLVRFKVGHNTAAFDYPIQIAHLHSGDISAYLNNIMIEAIPSSIVGNIKVWWDFSEGSAPYTDLSGNSNDGALTGTEQYEKESFPDPKFEVLT